MARKLKSNKNWKRHNLQLKRFEARLRPKRCKILAGVDEAGRGPLAGPVVACAVVLEKPTFNCRIFDSKQLSASARHQAFTEIRRQARIGLGLVDRRTIDRKNIHQATLQAMKRAVGNLNVKPEYVLVDGKFAPPARSFASQTVVGGDQRCLSIACASIIAKVVRDNLMSYYSALYPRYQFERNRGYGTKQHIQAIKKYGLTPLHRRSFRPMRSEQVKLKGKGKVSDEK